MSELMKPSGMDLATAARDNVSAVKELEKEIATLKDLKDKVSIRMDNAKEQLEMNKAKILEGMNKYNLKTFGGDDWKVTIRKATEVLVVTDESKIIDSGLWKVKRELDKTLVKARLKAGGKVSGCELGEGKQSLLIKFG